MKQFNWKYYFVLLLFVPVLLEIFLKAEDYITFLWTFALLMGYFVWILFSGIIFYKYNKKRGLRNEFCINYEYEMLTVGIFIICHVVHYNIFKILYVFQITVYIVHIG